MGEWLQFPIVEAPSGDDRTKAVFYQICEEFADINAAVNKRSPILQLWTHVVGILPPVNNINVIMRRSIKPTLTTLKDSVACFRGVMRPYDEEADGASILVYVLNVPTSIVFEPDMVCVARALKVPPATAITVQVRPTESLQIGGHDVTGIVTRIEPVFADGESPLLPREHGERYRQCLWR